MQLTTLSPPALIGDGVLMLWLYWGTSGWPRRDAHTVMLLLLSWMAVSKIVKLIPHFARYPVDVLLWPVSVMFGWIHGVIKCHALITLNEVRRTRSCVTRTVADMSRLHGVLELEQIPPTRSA